MVVERSVHPRCIPLPVPMQVKAGSHCSAAGSKICAMLFTVLLCLASAQEEVSRTNRLLPRLLARAAGFQVSARCRNDLRLASECCWTIYPQYTGPGVDPVSSFRVLVADWA